MRRILLASVVLATFSGSVFARCEPSSPVRELLKELQPRRDLIETADAQEARRAAFAKALTEHPDDYFILSAQMAAMNSADERAKWGAELLAQHPDKPLYALLNAQALLGKDSPEALRRLDALKASHPEMPEQYLVFAKPSEPGALPDPARAQEAFGQYEKLCPGATEISFLNGVLRSGSPELAARTATTLRTVLMADTGPAQHEKWQVLWSLEFKALPAPEHPEVRRRLGEDLARLEKSGQRTAERLAFLSNGYQSLGDPAASDRLEDEIIKSFLQSNEAGRVVQKRWRAAHPRPREPQLRDAYNRELLAAAQEWRKQWPTDSSLPRIIFIAISDLHESTSEQITQASEDFLATQHNKADVSALGVRLSVAQSYLKRQIHLDRIPGLLDASADPLAEHLNGLDDRAPEEYAQYMQFLRLGLLFDYYVKTKRTDEASAIEAKLEKLAGDKPSRKADVLAMRADAAEFGGRKADALALCRSAISAVPVGSDTANKLTEEAKRLWRELGGAPETYAMLGDGTQPGNPAAQLWRRPKNSLPSFSATDLQGAKWELAKLHGKIVLIDVWSTTCGPCLERLPDLQKLYEKTKDRGDVVVLSFNLDRNQERVAPYIAKNRYTFPVIFAQSMVEVESLPSVWLADGEGRLQWELAAYPSDWEAALLAKVDEMKKGG